MEILLHMKAVCNFYYRKSDLTNFKFDIMKFVFQPVHVSLVESEMAAFRQVLLGDSKHFQSMVISTIKSPVNRL
jgi:hypothetical protein